MSEEIIELIEGEFTKVIYKSDNYMVSRFKTEEGSITVTGPCFDYEKTQKYILTGTYVEHPKYGFQFSMLSLEKYLPSKKEEIISFLSSKSFPNIGKKVAEKIYDYFGDSTLTALKENPALIYELKLSDKQKSSIISGFENLNDPEKETFYYLISNGFNNLDAQKIFNKFKFDTISVGRDNPFKFYTDVYGISFDKVKAYASRIEFADAQNKYREAYLIHLLIDFTFNTGDIYILEEELLKILARRASMDNFAKILENAIEHNYLIKEENRIYLSADYHDEIFISNTLKKYSDEFVLAQVLIEEGIKNLECELKIEYDDLQKQAISNFFKNDMSLIVGGPGTGKTTIVKAMVNIFKLYFPFNNLVVVAPTGRAAKRINEICNIESKTIHSLLRWDKEMNTFAHNMENPIMYDAIIIDEFSMVDNSLFASLLKACGKVKKICLIGDDNQLPSIKAGYVLNDLIESKLFVSTHLISNYRQSRGSEIIQLCEDIRNGDIDLEKYHDDIRFLDIKKDNFSLVKLIEDDLKDAYSLDEIQVLAPMYKGFWGIDKLNIQLQNAFNPKDIDKNERAFGEFIFREDDKILQLKNRPNDDVYNGDIGTLEEINLEEKFFLVNYNGTYVLYNYDELLDISLAYAMSVHKSQGSEYQIVYFVVSKDNMRMLNKKLIYTAVSRAKSKLTIIGEAAVIKEGVSRMMKKRNTTLLERLLDE